MATPKQHECLYSALGAKVLARHFAIGRWRRANLLSLWNVLQEPAAEAVQGLSPSDVALVQRWNVVDHGRENPLLEGGKLLTALAVEVSLGYSQSSVPLLRGIETVGSLFPVRTGDAGWLVRWDPATSDHWEQQPNGSDVCTDFLVDDDGAYRFCVPATDPQRVPWRTLSTLRTLLPRPEADAYQLGEDPDHFTGYHPDYHYRYQVWEASGDEIVGVVGGLTIADRLVGRRGSGAVRRALVPPVRLLGEYLAANGYLLIRPCGGFNGRGATGGMPAMELPIARALGSIAGSDFASRLDFHPALERAGYSRNLDGRIRELVAAALAGAAILPPIIAGLAIGLGSLAPLVGAPIGTLAGTALEAAARSIGPVQIGTAAALFRHRDCFDVSNDASAREVALAYLLKEFEPKMRVEAWMAGMRLGGGNARGFPPHLAISALDDPDTTVRDAYLGLFRAERTRVAPTSPPEPGLLDSAHATAVAVILGATEFEGLLLRQLNERYDLLDAAGQDAEISNDQQNIRLAVDYLSAMALAWLHVSRRAAAGIPVATSGFPVLPSFTAWPAPAVPRVVLERLPEVRRVVLGDRPLPATDVDVFSPTVQSRKASTPPPVLSSARQLVGTFTYAVAESARDVFTGITLEWGDEYEIAATGEIRAGLALAGSNGPAGWTDQLVDDARWPLHTGLDPVGAHPFALLARVGGWFLVGEHMKRRRFLSQLSLPMHLRINDNQPGNGSGLFVVTVTLWGRERPIVYPERSILCATRAGGRIDRVGGVHPDGSPWQVTLTEAIEWIQRYGHTFTAGSDSGPRVVVSHLRGLSYLRSRGDRTRSNNLRRLPRCPART
ncbi:DUF3892 domain-containing protein [Kribbella sp. NBC_01510]|uniref:DUF3892 domain-containing protein n=1 Tax=Kribbella sp. NBC_01510 TaxID=2903581 RepID=UPI00386F1C65